MATASGSSHGGLRNPVTNLHEEAVCAICLDYFTDPVSIGCGHNFCRVCITQLWGASEGQEEEEDDQDEDEDVGSSGSDSGSDEEEVTDKEEETEEDVEYSDPENSPTPPQHQALTCPQCRKTFPHRNFRPNLQLANMVRIIHQLHPQPLKPVVASTETVELAVAGDSSGRASSLATSLVTNPGRTLCEKHQKPLKLFCETDEEPICVLCRESRNHKRHSVKPLEEVVQEYKAKLQGHLDPLKRKLETVLKQKSHEKEKIAALENKMKLDMKEFESDFERLHQFLLGEQALLHQLKDRYVVLLGTQNSNVTHLEEQGAALSSFIAEAEDKSEQGGLQDLKETLFRCEIIKFQDPEIIPFDTGKKYWNDFFIDILMRKMEKVFCKASLAALTLDPDTAHQRLTLSSDYRSVQLGEPWRELRDNPKRFNSDYCVLALQGFTCGRHYWKVEARGCRGWAVGATQESSENSNARGSQQKRELWCVGTSDKKYQALTTTGQTTLSPCGKLHHFCVYLDYERGQLAFYNAENMAHIHTFSASFHERIFPFFHIRSKWAHIKICN